jgi:hypothetical protein
VSRNGIVARTTVRLRRPECHCKAREARDREPSEAGLLANAGAPLLLAFGRAIAARHKLAGTSHPRRQRDLTGSVVADPGFCFQLAIRPSGSPGLSSPPATMRK